MILDLDDLDITKEELRQTMEIKTLIDDDFSVRACYIVYITWGNIVISNEKRKRDMARYGYPLCRTLGTSTRCVGFVRQPCK